eukprot:SAG31_NODE_8415_length_1456_cov_1.021371_2_plen_35_part_01
MVVPTGGYGKPIDLNLEYYLWIQVLAREIYLSCRR